MTVEEMLDRMSSHEFSEWQAYFGLTGLKPGSGVPVVPTERPADGLALLDRVHGIA